MTTNRHTGPLMFMVCIVMLLFSNPLLLATQARATPAQAFIGGKPPLNIYAFASPRNDFCYSDHIQAIGKLLKSEQERINQVGGIRGRPIAIEIRDDRGDSKRALENAKEA